MAKGWQRGENHRKRKLAAWHGGISESSNQWRGAKWLA